MAGVVVGCSGWLFVSPTFGPGLRKGVWNLAAQNPQLGKRPEWLESAGPVRMLKGGLSHVSYAVLEEQSNHGEEEVVSGSRGPGTNPRLATAIPSLISSRHKAGQPMVAASR